MIQYEHSPAGHKTEMRIGMDITAHFLIADFRFIFRLTFLKIFPIFREAVSVKEVIAAPSLDGKGLW